MSIRFDSTKQHVDTASKIGWFSGREKTRIHLGSDTDKKLSIALVKDQVFTKADLTSGWWENLLGSLHLRNWVALKVSNTNEGQTEELYVKVNKNSLKNRIGITKEELETITKDNILDYEKSYNLKNVILKREALDSVSENGNNIEKLEDFKEDEDVILAAIQKNPEAIQYIADSTYTNMDKEKQKELINTLRDQLQESSVEIQRMVCGTDRPWTPFLFRDVSPQVGGELWSNYHLGCIVSFLDRMDQLTGAVVTSNQAILSPRNLEVIKNYQATEDFNFEYTLKVLLILGSAVNEIPHIKQQYAAACERLGYCYLEGIGVKKDEHEAFKWYLRAADLGNANGESNLAICYSVGIGIEKDENAAFKWCEKAANQGHSRAKFNLGHYYENGIGVEKNAGEAIKWYTLAAEQGDPDAQFNLGHCYENGTGIEKNMEEAARWYTLAAEQGDPDAQNMLGRYYQNRVNKNENEAVKWYQLAAAQGNVFGLFNLGCCYAKGRGVKKDMNEAVRLYQLAADQGYADAQLNLGDCYENGTGIKKDMEEAIKWYQKAADQEHLAAKKHLQSLSKSEQISEDERLM